MLATFLTFQDVASICGNRDVLLTEPCHPRHRKRERPTAFGGKGQAEPDVLSIRYSYNSFLSLALGIPN